jgi:hypothetical protein
MPMSRTFGISGTLEFERHRTHIQGMTETQSQAPPTRADLISIMVISACVLAAEVALSRIFSAVLRYHFVFLVISVAICGIGVGGLLVYAVDRLRNITTALATAGFSAALTLFVVGLFKVVLVQYPGALWLIALLIMVPFVFAGMYLAVMFRRFSNDAAELYAWDLAGAAAAAVVVVYIMQLVNPVNTCLVIATVAGALATASTSKRALPAVVTVAAGVCLLTNPSARWLDIPPLTTSNTAYVQPLFSEMASDGDIEILHSDWDAFARTDVVRDPAFGDDAYLIYTNGNVPTRLARYDAETDEYAVSKLILSVPFAWQQAVSVLCIGPGGGLDMILAREVGASRVDGVEVNPAIPRILRIPQFAEYGGNPYALSGVQIEVGDGRTFAARTDMDYEMVFMALTKTATSSAGLSLVEGYIYTVEAIEDYRNCLTDNGRLVLVTDDRRMHMRLVNTAASALMNDGVAPGRVLDYLAVIRVTDEAMAIDPYQYALIIGKEPISAESAARLKTMTEEAGYVPELIPGDLTPRPYAAFSGLSGSLQNNWPMERSTMTQDFAIAAYDEWHDSVVAEHPQAAGKLPRLNLFPVNDNRPFFLDLSYGIPAVLKPLIGGSIAAVVLFSVFVVVREGKRRSDSRRGVILSVLYFSCLGVGFMMVEMPLIQKLILILGHPTRALTVALAALLLGGGIGSWLSGHIQRRPRAAVTACLMAALGGVLAAALILTTYELVLAWSLAMRIGWATIVCGLLGVLMGMPFPLGIYKTGQRNEELIPWLWGVNGFTSVLGSLLATVGAKFIGFQAVLACGALVYVLAAIVALGLRRE